MSLSLDPLAERSASQERARVMDRLRELELDGRGVLTRAAVAIRDCKAHSARVAALMAELRQADAIAR